MTEIPEHLRRRAQQARVKATEDNEELVVPVTKSSRGLFDEHRLAQPIGNRPPLSEEIDSKSKIDMSSKFDMSMGTRPVETKGGMGFTKAFYFFLAGLLLLGISQLFPMAVVYLFDVISGWTLIKSAILAAISMFFFTIVSTILNDQGWLR